MNELIAIQKHESMEIFTRRELITPLLLQIEHAATQETADTTTEKGRKAIASMAYRVAQSKTYIESYGKELAAELKELPKLVDANRKYARDFLDALKDTVRKPLDDWEKEQQAIALAEKVLVDHEQAFLDNVEFDVKKQVELERIAKEKADYEAKVLAQAKIAAEEQARREIAESEERARRAVIAAEEQARRAVIESEARALSAEREIIRVQEQAMRDIEIGAQLAMQKAKELQDKKEQIIQEQERIQEKARQQQSNVDAVHGSIIDDWMATGFDPLQSSLILAAVLDGKIRGLRVVY